MPSALRSADTKLRIAAGAVGIIILLIGIVIAVMIAPTDGAAQQDKGELAQLLVDAIGHDEDILHGGGAQPFVFSSIALGTYDPAQTARRLQIEQDFFIEIEDVSLYGDKVEFTASNGTAIVPSGSDNAPAASADVKRFEAVRPCTIVLPSGESHTGLLRIILLDRTREV